jgi:fatty acid desaturase
MGLWAQPALALEVAAPGRRHRGLHKGAEDMFKKHNRTVRVLAIAVAFCMVLGIMLTIVFSLWPTSLIIIALLLGAAFCLYFFNIRKRL